MPTLQMGWEWTIDRGRKEGLTSTGARNAIEQKRCARRTVLITLTETAGAVDHVEALADAHVGKAEMDIHIHTSHNAFKQWDGAAIDHARKLTREPEKPLLVTPRSQRRVIPKRKLGNERRSISR